MRRNQNRQVVGESSSVVEKQTQTDWTEMTEPMSLGAYMNRHVRYFPHTLSKSLAVNLTQFIERREYYASQLSGELLSVRQYYAAQLDQTQSRRASTQLIARPILVYPERLEREWAGDVEYEHTIDVPRWITENVVRELRQSIDDVAEIWVDFQLGDLRNWSGRGFVHRFHHNPIYPVITIVTHDRCFAQLCYSGFYITIETTAFYGKFYRDICHTGEYPDFRSMHRMHSADDALIVRTSGDMHIYQRLGMMDDDETISFGREVYAPQTKILEGGTKDEIRIFDGLFNGTWPKLSTHALEKCFDNHHFLFCSSFQNLRLGWGKVAQTGHLSDRTAPMAHFWAQVDDGPHVARNQRTLNSSNSESIPPQRKGYDVVQWWNPDGTRSPPAFQKTTHSKGVVPHNHLVEFCLHMQRRSNHRVLRVVWFYPSTDHTIGQTKRDGRSKTTSHRQGICGRANADESGRKGRLDGVVRNHGPVVWNVPSPALPKLRRVHDIDRLPIERATVPPGEWDGTQSATWKTGRPRMATSDVQATDGRISGTT